jgi:hypoxanthine phosphoribosyltransferase
VIGIDYTKRMTAGKAHDQLEVVFDQAAIEGAMERLVRDLSPFLAGGGWTALGILDGCFIFMADLVRRLPGELRVDFIRYSSYPDGTAPQPEPELVSRPRRKLAGERVLLIDNIVDTGRTLRLAREFLRQEGAAQVVTCVLVDKTACREGDLRPDFTGLTVAEDLFLVGYGLDVRGRFRDLPFIGVPRE